MDALLKSIFSTAHYPTTSRKEQALVLYWLAGIVLVADVLLAFILPTSPGRPSPVAAGLQSGDPGVPIVSTLVILVALGAIGLVREGYYRAAAWLMTGMLMIAVTYTSLTSVPNDFEFVMMAFVVVVSALTLQEQGLLVIGIASTLLYAAGFVRGVPVTFPGFSVFIAFILLVYAFVRFVRVSQSEGQMMESAERVKLADINTRITRQASERMNLQQALDSTLALILRGYSQLYHAQVFLIDDDGVQARLVASTGPTGQELIRKGHSLAVGSLSVIGQTTFKGEPVIARADDTETVHRENELLPETRIEVAFPLRIGSNIIGALDLQSRELLDLTDYDMVAFQSLANSLSLAIDSIRQYEAAQEQVQENRRLAEQARTALREVERLNQRLIGRAWSEYLGGRSHELGLDVNFEQDEAQQAVEWTPTLRNAALSNAIVQERNVIAMPLRVRGVVVGAMEFELDDEGEFTPAEMELVQEISDRFGLAVENTRLVEESQRVAQRETLINEISSRLQSANNVEATLVEAARSLSETLQAGKVTIRLGAPGEDSAPIGLQSE